MRILALGGVAGPALFASVVVLCAALRPEYSHLTQMMSELGETGGPYASLMNAAGFVPSGLLLIAFGGSLAWLVPRTQLSVVGALLVVLFGAGIASAGVFSCDSGCPRQGISQEATLHTIVSVIAFLSAVAACAIWAFVFRRLNAWRSLWIYSASSAAVAFVLLLIFNASVESRTLSGVWQRLFLGTLYLWCAVVGAYAFRFTSPSRHTA